ncbi:hypothetical protein HAX54_033162 [Datura stramonium]|uniref:Nudix hydrolase domain-containing protein n=1 Tax=Datura stramonium TaxID=4076 RepID=A0ABS8VEV3_DATST|nr:hypothetical protein [Datura stramonium]
MTNTLETKTRIQNPSSAQNPSALPEFLCSGGWENDETVKETAFREAIEEDGVRGDLVPTAHHSWTSSITSLPNSKYQQTAAPQPRPPFVVRPLLSTRRRQRRPRPFVPSSLPCSTSQRPAASHSH